MILSYLNLGVLIMFNFNKRKKKIDKIKMIGLDIDGTLTDGNLILGNDNFEMKRFYTKDGMAILRANEFGLKSFIITGRKSDIITRRAKELKIKYIYQGIKDKKQCLKTICNDLNILFDEIAYIGDDINDLSVMTMVGFSACPKDACLEVKKESDMVSKYNGGHGAIREIFEKILKQKGVWNKIIENSY